MLKNKKENYIKSVYLLFVSDKILSWSPINAFNLDIEFGEVPMSDVYNLWNSMSVVVASGITAFIVNQD